MDTWQEQRIDEQGKFRVERMKWCLKTHQRSNSRGNYRPYEEFCFNLETMAKQWRDILAILSICCALPPRPILHSQPWEENHRLHHLSSLSGGFCLYLAKVNHLQETGRNKEEYFFSTLLWGLRLSSSCCIVKQWLLPSRPSSRTLDCNNTVPSFCVLRPEDGNGFLLLFSVSLSISYWFT